MRPPAMKAHGVTWMCNNVLSSCSLQSCPSHAVCCNSYSGFAGTIYFLKLIRRFSKIGQPTMVPETLLWVVCLNRFTMFSLKAMFGCLGTGTVIFSFLSVLFTRDSTVGCNLRCCCYCCCFDINNIDMIAVSVGNCISIVLIFEV